MVIGLYLLAIGVAGEWLRRTGQPLWTDLSIVLAFGSVIGLTILLFSKKAGSEIRRFIVRNFYRSKYDYRARWLEVTKTFQQATTKDAIIDCLFDLLIEDFSDDDHIDLVIPRGGSPVSSGSTRSTERRESILD